MTVRLCTCVHIQYSCLEKENGCFSLWPEWFHVGSYMFYLNLQTGCMYSCGGGGGGGGLSA